MAVRRNRSKAKEPGKKYLTQLAKMPVAFIEFLYYRACSRQRILPEMKLADGVNVYLSISEFHPDSSASQWTHLRVSARTLEVDLGGIWGHMSGPGSVQVHPKFEPMLKDAGWTHSHYNSHVGGNAGEPYLTPPARFCAQCPHFLSCKGLGSF